ncbi:hypothetical protein Ocin01_15569 [Orchesella cincta]|uniref:Uncharacterized protein n=1 Tax=Orchesella cincta TaxID=48709 RepID=A0A1D2MDU0_ORCCI|nr:hypothetical protein Ocin01_15569 [Orchesella cincta]
MASTKDSGLTIRGKNYMVLFKKVRKSKQNASKKRKVLKQGNRKKLTISKKKLSGGGHGSSLKTVAAISSSLDLSESSLPYTDVSVISPSFERIYPTVALSDENMPADFFIPASNLYMDLGNIILVITGKIVDSKGTDLNSSTTYAPYYNYAAYLTTLIESSKDEKETRLRSQLWYEDNAPTHFTANNTGYTYRLNMSKGSKSVEMASKLYHGLFSCDKYLKKGISMRIILKRSSSQHDVESAHDAMNKNGKLYYPYLDSNLVSYAIPAGNTSHISQALQIGRSPSMSYVTLIKTTSYYGVARQTSFTFSHNNVSSVSLTLDGKPLLHKTLDIDVDKPKHYDESLSHSNITALPESIRSAGISPETFANTSFVVCYNLLPVSLTIHISY